MDNSQAMHLAMQCIQQGTQQRNSHSRKCTLVEMNGKKLSDTSWIMEILIEDVIDRLTYAI